MITIMNNIIFPPGLNIVKNNINIEILKEFAEGWDIEYLKMEKGDLNLSFEVTHTPRVQLAYENYEKGVLIKGQYPQNAVVLAVVHSEGKANFKQNILETNELIIAHSDEVLDFLSFKKSYIYTITIEENLFYSTFYNHFSKDGIYMLKNKQLFIKPNQLEAFEHNILKWINFFKNTTIENKKYILHEKEILNDIFSALIIKNKSKERLKFDISKVRKDLDKYLQDAIDIPILSKKHSISERQLHNTFKRIYGYTPKQYLNSLRLNAIRKIFLSKTKDTIFTIASQYQYFHMGHFSKEYKKMFNETPTETRKTT